MEPKRYSSYEEIDNELAILKLEREIHFQKTALSFSKAKDSISPSSLISGTIESITPGYASILKSLAGLIIMNFLKRRISRKD